MKRRRAWLVALALGALAVAPALQAQDAPAASARPRDVERLRERLEQLRERAAALASATPSAVVSAAPLPSALLEVPGAAELAKRWAALSPARHERRLQQHAKLTQELGARLAEPAVAAELKLHAKRVAELGRIEFLAQNARQGAARAQLLARVAQLNTRETERHRKQLATLSATPAPRPSSEARP